MFSMVDKLVGQHVSSGLITDLGLLAAVSVIQWLVWKRLKTVGLIYRLASRSIDASGVRTYKRSLDQLALDLESARRYQRPLSVAVLVFSDERPPSSSKPASAGGNGNSYTSSQDHAINLVLPFVGSVLQDSLRGIDKGTINPARREFVIVLAETKKSNAGLAVARLQNSFIAKSGIQLKSGLAEFPSDGYTLPDLIETARDCAMGAQERGARCENVAKNLQGNFEVVLSAKDIANT